MNSNEPTTATSEPEPLIVHTGETFPLNGHQVEVQPPCGNNRGQWLCVTHSEMFENNLMMWNHRSTIDSDIANWTKKVTQPPERCKIGWVCFEHGLEQP